MRPIARSVVDSLVFYTDQKLHLWSFLSPSPNLRTSSSPSSPWLTHWSAAANWRSSWQVGPQSWHYGWVSSSPPSWLPSSWLPSSTPHNRRRSWLLLWQPEDPHRRYESSQAHNLTGCSKVSHWLQLMLSCWWLIMASPPSTRFLNRLYDSCVTTANKSSLFRYHLLIRSVSNDFQKILFIIFSQFSRHIFNFALSSKTGELYKGIVRRDSIWDKLIFWLVF